MLIEEHNGDCNESYTLTVATRDTSSTAVSRAQAQDNMTG